MSDINSGFDNGYRPTDSNQEGARDASGKTESDSDIGKNLYTIVQELTDRTAALQLPRYGYDASPLQMEQGGQQVTVGLTYFPSPLNNETRTLTHTATTAQTDGVETVQTITLATGLVDSPPGSVSLEVTKEKIEDSTPQFVSRRGVRYIAPVASSQTGKLLVFDSEHTPPDALVLEEGPDKQSVLDRMPNDIAFVEKTIKAYETAQRNKNT